MDKRVYLAGPRGMVGSAIVRQLEWRDDGELLLRTRSELDLTEPQQGAFSEGISRLKIAIITVCYNSAKTIRDTIESVLSQTGPDVEYIIVDGASSDGTLSIVNEYRERITRIISESDQGIYDAMNKGIQ